MILTDVALVYVSGYPENIIKNKCFIQQKYYKVVFACCKLKHNKKIKNKKWLRIDKLRYYIKVKISILITHRD